MLIFQSYEKISLPNFQGIFLRDPKMVSYVKDDPFLQVSRNDLALLIRSFFLGGFWGGVGFLDFFDSVKYVYRKLIFLMLDI